MVFLFYLLNKSRRLCNDRSTVHKDWACETGGADQNDAVAGQKREVKRSGEARKLFHADEMNERRMQRYAVSGCSKKVSSLTSRHRIKRNVCVKTRTKSEAERTRRPCRSEPGRGSHALMEEELLRSSEWPQLGSLLDRQHCMPEVVSRLSVSVPGRSVELRSWLPRDVSYMRIVSGMEYSYRGRARTANATISMLGCFRGMKGPPFGTQETSRISICSQPASQRP